MPLIYLLRKASEQEAEREPRVTLLAELQGTRTHTHAHFLAGVKLRVKLTLKTPDSKTAINQLQATHM